MAKGLSRMKGNFHVRFLGGWRVVTLSGYPVGVMGTHGTGEAGACLCAPWGADGGGTGASAVRARVSPPRGAGSSGLAAQRPTGARQRDAAPALP